MTTPMLLPGDYLSRVLTLSPVSASVPAARRWAHQMLTRWSLPHLVERVELIVSELVANATLHARAGGNTVTILLMYASDTLRLEVRDRDLINLPELQSPALSEHGWGLVLVDACSDRWGTRVTDTYKTVWCELDNDDPRLTALGASGMRGGHGA